MKSKYEEDGIELLEVNDDGQKIEQKNEIFKKNASVSKKLISLSLVLLVIFFVFIIKIDFVEMTKPNPSGKKGSGNMYLMKCKTQNYDWGKDSNSSLITKILKANKQEVDPSKKYAEFWMGAHINAPSEISVSDKFVSLSDYTSKSKINYLFKVLSIAKPLSIQLHPDKNRAKVLHKNLPDKYKDDNHKPELFVVISDTFDLLVGLKSLNSAHDTLSLYKKSFNFAEAEKFLKDKSIENYSNFFNKLISLEKDEYEKIINGIQNERSNKDNNKLVDLLVDNFGKDLGILVALFMNHLTKKKGESLFIGPDFPHAYLKGDCYEVMANSDNVIRLGLTPKFKDTNTFKEIVDVNFKGMIFDPESSNKKYYDYISYMDGITTYHKKGFDDFGLRVLKLTEKSKNIDIKEKSILYIGKGNVSFLLGKNKIKATQYQSFYIDNNINLKIINDDKQLCEILIVSDFY